VFKLPDRFTFLKTAGGSLLGGIIGALLGGLAGYAAAKLQPAATFGDLIYPLTGLVLGYGAGTGMAAYLTHRMLKGRKSFARAFFSALTGLFLVVFLSEPLRLNQVPPLMWALLFILPPVLAALMLPLDS
jgi:hypothetical protein